MVLAVSQSTGGQRSCSALLSLPSDTSALDHGLQQQGDDRRLALTMSLWGPALIEQLAGQHQLITDSPSDIIEPPENSLIIANRIPFSWLAFFEGGMPFSVSVVPDIRRHLNVVLQ